MKYLLILLLLASCRTPSTETIAITYQDGHTDTVSIYCHSCMLERGDFKVLTNGGFGMWVVIASGVQTYEVLEIDGKKVL